MDACLQVTASQAAEPSPPIAIDREQLQAYLRRHFHAPGLAIAEFRVIVGGRSRQTVLFTISGTSGVPVHLVCQRDHPANINPQGSVTVQYALLRYLHESGLKVPRPVLFETGRSALGAPFVITEKVPGTTVIDAATEYYAAPPRSARLASSLAGQMGRLHTLAPAPVKNSLRTTLADAASWASEVARMRKCWHEQATGPSVVVEAALAWLERNIGCVTDRTTIVHTDMLLHNILVENGEVSAVLDWEIAHIGHPAEDLGYVRPVIEQMTDWSTFMSAYIAAGGAQIGQRETDWFSLRALVHLATLAQFSRNMLDSNSSDDIRVAETGASWLPRLKERLATLLLSILANDGGPTGSA
jgi:aminoglycoside phosphotransferase (APT) family kinase protein